MRTKPFQGRRRLRVRTDRLRQLARARFECPTDDALAALLGMDRSNFSRLVNGQQPRTATVVLLLDMFEVEFWDLFEAYDTPSQTSPAA